MTAIASSSSAARRTKLKGSLSAVSHYEGGEGPATVLLHGFTDTWRAWTPLFPYLEPERSLYAPSLPGHWGGESFPPGEKMTIPGSLDRIERMLDARGIDKAHLVGSSLGGWAAFELAARGRALSVVAVCPAGGWNHGSKEEAAVHKYFRKNAQMLKVTGRHLHLAAASAVGRKVGLRELVADPSKVDAQQAYAMFMGALGCEVTQDALELAAAEDTFGELPPIDVPVRVLYGTKDRIVRWPSHYPRLRSMLPNAEFVPLEGMGHLPMFDDPKAVADAILAPF